MTLEGNLTTAQTNSSTHLQSYSFTLEAGGTTQVTGTNGYLGTLFQEVA